MKFTEQEDGLQLLSRSHCIPSATKPATTIWILPYMKLQ